RPSRARVEIEPGGFPRPTAALPFLGALVAPPRLRRRRTAHRARTHPGKPGTAGERVRGRDVHGPLPAHLSALMDETGCRAQVRHARGARSSIRTANKTV